MIAYKGFNKNMECTRGKGTFKYEIGKTYKENTAQCASTGFHCCEEPIQVLNWYSGPDSRYCIVDAGGDIHEDGTGRVSCTEITVLKEITLQQLGILECQWMHEKYERKESKQIQRDEGFAGKNEIVIVRGKDPKAKGEIGSTLFLVKENPKSREIISIGIYPVDNAEYFPNKYYDTDGKVVK